MKYREAERMAANRFRAEGIRDAEADSRFLLEFVTGMQLSSLLLHANDEMDTHVQERFFQMVQIRASHVPLQQITGEQEFMGFRFKVNEHVLIPRLDTEVLTEEALKAAGPKDRVLDLCTGSGCIGISMKLLRPDLDVTLSDQSEAALETAAGNAKLHHCAVKLIHSDLFADISGKYDLIVSNPPYIPTAEIERLDEEVRAHEPVSALDGREDGLWFYRRIVQESPEYLTENGKILFEIGCEQGAPVREMLEEHGFTDICVIRDLAGLDRVVSARRKG